MHIFCINVLVSSDGSQHSGVPDGMFRKPSEGQSLISYLSEQDFGSCADLEKVGGVQSSLQRQFCFKELCTKRGRVELSFVA